METFVVRVWRPAAGDAVTGFHGRATRLSSGDEISFADAETLLAFMGQQEAEAREPPWVGGTGMPAEGPCTDTN